MTGPRGLPGRRDVLDEVGTLLAAGRSVLLVGPPGIGKSAIIAAMGWPPHLVVDPLEQLSRQAAARIRRGMDRGQVYLAAARTPDHRSLGCVGRIAWRMTVVHVRPLDARAARNLLLGGLAANGVPRAAIDGRWLRTAVRSARGIPARARGLAEAAAAHWRRTSELPPVSIGVVLALTADAAVVNEDRSVHVAVRQPSDVTGADRQSRVPSAAAGPRFPRRSLDRRARESGGIGRRQA